MKDPYHLFRFSHSRLKELKSSPLNDARDKFGVSCPEPTATFYLYPSFTKSREPLAARGMRTCQDLSHYLLDNFYIVILPGVTFGDDLKALSLHLSTSFLNMESNDQAQDIVSAFDDDVDPDRFINNHHPRMREVIARLADFVSELEGST